MQNKPLALKKVLTNENQLLDYAANFAEELLPMLSLNCCVIYLHGELGAGKTTFVRGFLRGLCYSGLVKSPTFTFVQSYELPDKLIHHFDLYRITDPEELESKGIRDYFIENTLCFIEWPSRAASYLPKADIDIFIKGVGDQRCVDIKFIV